MLESARARHGLGGLVGRAHRRQEALECWGIWSPLQDFDRYEIHEASASQVLCTLAAWGDRAFCRDWLGRDEPLGSIPTDKLNLRGGSLAAGHPFAATGGRIVSALAKELHASGGGRGVISGRAPIRRPRRSSSTPRDLL